MKIWRIRMTHGVAGGSNHYSHADIIAPTWWKALRAAKEGRVHNWRWIDTYDTSDETYEDYEYLYPVGYEKGDMIAHNPRKPHTKLQKRIDDFYAECYQQLLKTAGSRRLRRRFNHLFKFWDYDLKRKQWPPLYRKAEAT